MARFEVTDFDRRNFPALFRCADAASTLAQRYYTIWFRINLGLLIAGAVVGSLMVQDVEHRQVVQIIAAIIFFLATGTTVLLANRRWERVWYAGRAVAESLKSLTWKFVCGANPFPETLPEGESTSRFTETLAEVLRENKHLSAWLVGDDSTGDQVSAFMTSLRASTVGVRRDVYLSQRVNEQQAWYAKKSAENRKYQLIWFIMLVFFQAGAVAAAIFLAIYPMFPWRMTAVFSTLAAVTGAWGQMKRYQELAQAYGLATHELSLIAARASSVKSADDLARFVNDAETAISREHSTWVARRETQ